MQNKTQQPDEATRKARVAKLLMFIYAEYNKQIDDTLIKYWMHNLRANRVQRTYAKEAAERLVASKSYGEPKFGDFMKCYWEVFDEHNEPKLRTGYNPHVNPELELKRERADYERTKKSRQVVHHDRKLIGGSHGE